MVWETKSRVCSSTVSDPWTSVRAFTKSACVSVPLRRKMQRLNNLVCGCDGRVCTHKRRALPRTSATQLLLQCVVCIAMSKTIDQTREKACTPHPQLELGPVLWHPPSLTLTPTQRNSHRHKLRCLLQMQTHAAENSDVSEPSQITTACAWTRSHAPPPYQPLSSRGMRGNHTWFSALFLRVLRHTKGLNTQLGCDTAERGLDRCSVRTIWR
jgi:hypothetical protein